MPPTSRPRISAVHRAALEANPWFASMSHAQRDTLLGAAELIHVRRGAMVFRQGDPVHVAGAGFYGLAAGTIEISTRPCADFALAWRGV